MEKLRKYLFLDAIYTTIYSYVMRGCDINDEKLLVARDAAGFAITQRFPLQYFRDKINMKLTTFDVHKMKNDKDDNIDKWRHYRLRSMDIVYDDLNEELRNTLKQKKNPQQRAYHAFMFIIKKEEEIFSHILEITKDAEITDIDINFSILCEILLIFTNEMTADYKSSIPLVLGYYLYHVRKLATESGNSKESMDLFYELIESIDGFDERKLVCHKNKWYRELFSSDIKEDEMYKILDTLPKELTKIILSYDCADRFGSNKIIFERLMTRSEFHQDFNNTRFFSCQ